MIFARALEAQGWSNERLAAEFGRRTGGQMLICTSTIRNYRCGRSKPDVDIAIVLSEILGIDVKVLFADTLSWKKTSSLRSSEFASLVEIGHREKSERDDISTKIAK